MLADGPRHQVGRATGGERNHHPDLFVGIGTLGTDNCGSHGRREREGGGAPQER